MQKDFLKQVKHKRIGYSLPNSIFCKLVENIDTSSNTICFNLPDTFITFKNVGQRWYLIEKIVKEPIKIDQFFGVMIPNGFITYHIVDVIPIERQSYINNTTIKDTLSNQKILYVGDEWLIDISEANLKEVLKFYKYFIVKK